MEIVMKALNLILSSVLILSLMLSAGCGDSPTGPGKETEEKVVWTTPAPQLVGMWLFTSANVNGSPSGLSDALDWESGSAYAAIEILSDGTLYYAEFDEYFEVTISGEGRVYSGKAPYTSKFKFNLTNDHGDTLKVSGTWSVSGDNLILNGKADDKSIKLTCEEI
jgi:hypothetical protein